MCNFNTPPFGFKQMNEYSLWVRWKAIHQTANPLPGAPLDTVSKWMLITRSYVFEMNIYAGMVGILLALQFVTETTSLMYYEGAIIIVGLILAHAANNMMNDFFDTLHGLRYSQALYESIKISRRNNSKTVELYQIITSTFWVFVYENHRQVVKFTATHINCGNGSVMVLFYYLYNGNIM